MASDSSNDSQLRSEPPSESPSEALQAPVQSRHLVLIAVSVLLCVACDQASKYVATEQLQGEPMQSFWGDFFRLTYVENRGAFLGLGNDWPDPVRWLLFNAGAIVIVGLCSFWVINSLRRDGGMSASVWALLLIGAGGIGNLIDRLWRDGAVIDFMNLGIGWLRTGIFNVADVHIMVGLGLLLLARRAPEPKDSGAAEPPVSA